MQADPSFLESSTTAAGLRLHYIEAGQGELLVLIHGSLCDYRYWRWQIPELSGYFHVVAPSLPGCWPEAVGSHTSGGPYDSPREAALADSRYSMAQHVRAIVDFCQRQSPEHPVHLLGHSRGAQVALEAALAMPGRIGRLVLADPGFPFTHEAVTEPIHVPIAHRLGQAATDDVLEEFVDTVNGSHTWRRTVSWFKNMVRANAWTLLPQVNDIHRAVDHGSLAAGLPGPVMLIGGEHSPPRYGSRIDILKQALPHAQHVVVPQAAHGMNLANARYFNDAILGFLLGERA